MKQPKTNLPMSDADKRWGYHFGIDGIMNMKDLQQFLGNISRTTIDDYARAELIRRGKRGSSVVFCKRSLVRYVATLEE